MLCFLLQAQPTLLPDGCEVKGFPLLRFFTTTFYLATHPETQNKPTMTDVSEMMSLNQPYLFSQAFFYSDKV